MPLLDLKGLKQDIWSLDAKASHRIVALAELARAIEQRANEQRIAVVLTNTTVTSEVENYLGRVTLIAIPFPAYADGRGFSLAKRLRNLGFKETLRASGPLIADQFAYAIACGFDEIDLPEALASRQPIEHWLKAAEAFSANYQRGYAGKGSILDQRRKAVGPAVSSMVRP